MANPKILERKQNTIDEIKEKFSNATTSVFVDYAGLSVAETTLLRRKLKEVDSEIKIYKNTLAKRALDTLNVDFGDELNGPKAVVFGTDAVAPIKVLSDFAKEHPALELKVGYVDGSIADKAELEKLAATPNRDTLLTMFAAGLLEHVKNVAICLDLHSKNLEENN